MIAMKKKDICYCDRCGMFYNYYGGGKTFKNTERANAVSLIDMDLERDYSVRQIYDLCPDCMKELEHFLNKKTK